MPMPAPLRVLMVEDDRQDVDLCLHELRRADFQPTSRTVQTPGDLQSELGRGAWDVILSDYTMPGFNAIEALEIVRRNDAEVPFIVVTGTLDEETAVDCLKRGADNYVLKENLARLGAAVQQSLKFRDEHRHRQRLEHQLREAQKMEALGQLAAGIAHDFNNLITAMMGYAQVARLLIPPGHELTSPLDGIQQACTSAAALTKSLLTFSCRGEAQRLPLHLGRFVQDTLRLIRHMLPATIEVHADTATSAPIFVKADANQLQQVLLNLVLNSRDAMPRGGELGLRVLAEPCPEEDVFDMVSTAGLGCVRLTVEDTGDGIPEHALPHIFEPFYTTKPRGQGTGLGLSIVHAIVTDHGGTIDVLSRPGRGTSIDIRLPRVLAPQPETTDDDPTVSRRGQGQSILIVEDHRQVRAIMAECLANAGYRVLQACDGAQGLEQLRAAATPVDLVILDVDLPKLDGPTCLLAMRETHPAQRALLISGLANRASIATTLPGEDVLPKPFSMSQLLAAVDERCTAPSMQGECPK
ncbi:MAG: response regulator [Phycisphaerales bacterium]|nr:response regulator [Phycisphaerales bacterium]